jgi:hypothetical protein
METKMPLTTQQIEAQRVKFENWYDAPVSLSISNGDFANGAARAAFAAWCAAIESVEIEIPPGFVWQSEGGDDVIYIADLEQSIEQQGYKVKS